MTLDAVGASRQRGAEEIEKTSNVRQALRNLIGHEDSSVAKAKDAKFEDS
jgi:succinylglutamate desuccinylase